MGINYLLAKLQTNILKKQKRKVEKKRLFLKKNNIQVRLRIAISRLASLSLPSLAFCICLNIFGQYWGRNDDDSAGWMTTHWTGRDDKWRHIKQKATFISNKKYPCNNVVIRHVVILSKNWLEFLNYKWWRHHMIDRQGCIQDE